jgi:hypothetical protein
MSDQDFVNAELQCGLQSRSITRNVRVSSCSWIGQHIIAGDGAGGIHLFRWIEQASWPNRALKEEQANGMPQSP